MEEAEQEYILHLRVWWECESHLVSVAILHKGDFESCRRSWWHCVGKFQGGADALWL